MSKYYYCYSKPLHLFLGAFNIRYVSKAIHPTTYKLYWMYEKNENLDALIKEWNTLKEKYLLKE